MTPSKMWYAEKLAKLLNDGTTAEQLAEKMSVRRLCYEIEKLEETEPEPEPEAEPVVEQVKEKEKKVKSFWARISLETSSDEEDDDDLETKEA
jgi:hypothetical protein